MTKAILKSHIRSEDKDRILGIDYFRGLGVLGFIIWHSFDILFEGDRFTVPLFRLLIFTTGSFVAASGLAIGLKINSEKPKRFLLNLKRGLRLIAFPITVALFKTALSLSPEPVLELLAYPFGGSGLSTFSILFVLGFISIIVPYISRESWIQFSFVFIFLGIGIVELFNGNLLPKFYDFLLIGILCSQFSDKIILLMGKRLNFLYTSIFFITFLVMEIIFANYPFIYWYSKARLITHLFILFITGVSIAQLCLANTLLIKPVKQLLLMFGRNSLFVYIFHYVVLASVAFLLGFDSFDAPTTLLAASVLTVFCYLICVKILPVFIRITIFKKFYLNVFGGYYFSVNR